MAKQASTSSDGSAPGLEPIAIIGMACIFPQAPDLESFWNNLLDGVDAVSEPVAGWDAQRYLEAGRIRTASGGYLKELYRFDPREFGIMPNSLDGGEPDQFLALRVARDALLDAGYLRPDFDHTDTGIILGHSTYLHRGQVNVIQNHIALDQTLALMRAAVPSLDDAALAQVKAMLQAKLPQMNADIAPGLVPNVMTGRIANRLNLRGPNYLVDAACSSSLLAVSAALDELRARRSRLMLAGGVNASLPADVAAIFTQLGALSGRGKVRPFEAGSDGTLLGEGLGVVVLKRLAEAQADRDRIYAVLRGVGQASDGKGTGLLAPSMEGQTLSLRRAYDSTGVDPSTISMVEAHGTGIPLGDKTEIGTLRHVFGERVGPQGSIALGSVKSMISHCIPAAGIAGLIKTALSLHHKVLAPTLCDAVNPELGIDRTPLYINTETRPWIAPLGLPRRAGVDSFGFGGINTHAIVEEAPAEERAPSSLSRWPFELCVWSATDREALSIKLQTVLDGMSANPDWRLGEIASALAHADTAAECRLVIVAKDKAGLIKAIATAREKLAGANSGGWSTRSGIHFSAERATGKLAFLFPGEGSQYLGMLSDLALHFGEVRQWLDFWHGLYAELPGASRTDIVFPPASELTAERRKQLEQRLHDMDVGSEAVMVGGQALFTLLKSLGVQPDVMLGHSSGESSALVASGALPAADFATLADFIRELNAVYQRVLTQGHVATGALLAVGALPAGTVRELMAASGTDVVVAMDNCANQLVLYGDRISIDRVQADLQKAGGICLPLPFDRGYHTPAFSAVSEAFHAYYKQVRLAAPQVPMYSCASAAPFPTSPAAVRKLAAAQWSATVRFRETVERMYADGVRCFVEVGPSGNLTAFVGDILPDQPHLALASNVRRRHGLEQLLSVLGQLYVRGYPADLQKLFAARRIAAIDLSATADCTPKGVLLDNTMPTLRLDDSDRALLATLVLPASSPALAPTTGEAHNSAPNEPPPHPEPVREAPADDSDGSSVVMGDYFALMRSFLDVQQNALAGWSAATGEIDPVHDLEQDSGGRAVLSQDPDLDGCLPFLDEVVERSAQSLVARCQLSLHRDAFLRDHVLSGRGSETDPDLLGLSCVPLMVSLEIMAEACALLSGSAAVSSIEQVQAFDWIALDEEDQVIEVHAQAVEGEAGLYRASLHQSSGRCVTALVRFGGGAMLPGVTALKEQRPPRWDGPGIYEAGMFHGPIFQSLAAIAGWDDGGIDAELSPVSLQGFFEPGHAARMVLNPVLLDAMGQLAACWTAEYAGTDFNAFPSTIARIEFLAHGVADVPGLRLRGRQAAPGGERAGDVAAPRAWQFECSTAEGSPLVRVDGWVNVFFHVPNRFYQVRRDPLNGWLGSPFALPQRPAVSLWQMELLAEDFCAQSSAIFLRMLAHATLSFDERETWRSLQGPVRQRRQWLLGRLCLKEAVRHWVFEHTGHLLYPSDVVVTHDEAGAPWVDGWWSGSLVAAPRVSLSHTDRFCVAAVAPADQPVGIDTEDASRRRRPELLMQALTPTEQSQVAKAGEAGEDALLRIWCAKEAAAKRLGSGLRGEPLAFEVMFTDAALSAALVHADGTMIEVSITKAGNDIVAVADSTTSGVGVQE